MFYISLHNDQQLQSCMDVPDVFRLPSPICKVHENEHSMPPVSTCSAIKPFKRALAIAIRATLNILASHDIYHASHITVSCMTDAYSSDANRGGWTHFQHTLLCTALERNNCIPNYNEPCSHVNMDWNGIYSTRTFK